MRVEDNPGEQEVLQEEVKPRGERLAARIGLHR